MKRRCSHCQRLVEEVLCEECSTLKWEYKSNKPMEIRTVARCDKCAANAILKETKPEKKVKR